MCRVTALWTTQRPSGPHRGECELHAGQEAVVHASALVGHSCVIPCIARATCADGMSTTVPGMCGLSIQWQFFCNSSPMASRSSFGIQL